MTSVEVIPSDLSSNPQCPHGPTLLFSRYSNKNHGEIERFYACAACRDRKLCSFYLLEKNLPKIGPEKKAAWEKEQEKFYSRINHHDLYKTFQKARKQPENQRFYCLTCNKFISSKNCLESTHNVRSSITSYQLTHPTEMLPHKEDPKKEAQYLFAKSTIEGIIKIMENLKIKKVLSIGTPRLHEYINSEKLIMRSLLLDFDERFHSFYSSLEFCWYNCFNHHFFFKESEKIFEKFIETEKLALIMDPPFGGRIEPLVTTIRTIETICNKTREENRELSLFLVFPYFMEPHVLNHLPELKMLDYKVDYDNHTLFQDGPKGRKHGSPVRIFTNVNLSGINLNFDKNYKHCAKCNRWVMNENKHCDLCELCPSKDGRTYRHCDRCSKCVKPTWQHCNNCERCAQPDHVCLEIPFKQSCFHCKTVGHKKRDCPLVDKKELLMKRKKTCLKEGKSKKQKLKS